MLYMIRVVLDVNLPGALQLGTGAAFPFKILPRLGKGLEERHQQVPHEGNSQPRLPKLTLVPDEEGWTVLSVD